MLPAESEPFNKVVDLALKFERKEQKFQAEKSARAKAVENSRDTRPLTQQKDVGRSGNRFRPYDQGQRGHQY